VSELLVALLLAFMVGLAVYATWTTDLFAAAVSLGAYGFVMSLVWAEIGALDVAFTEAVVGAGATTVLFLATLLRTARQASPAPPALRGLAIAGGLALFAAFTAAGGGRRPRGGPPAPPPPPPTPGDTTSPPSLHVSPRYLERTLDETATPNAVTSVLADYRGYDTLVETTVIVTAGLGCWLLLQPRRA
jgi:multicomponent Na+:H+ antiporter subunit B